MKYIWLPDSETKVEIDSSGNMRIWDEIIMTREILAKETGFTIAQLSNNNDPELLYRQGQHGSEP